MKHTLYVQNPLRRNPNFREMSDEEAALIQSFKRGDRRVRSGDRVFAQGDEARHLFTVTSGMGVRRQAVGRDRSHAMGFALPGDFVGLQPDSHGPMRTTLEATTDMQLCVFDREAIHNLFRAHPEQAFTVTYVSAREECFLGDAMPAVSQRGALEKIAWAFERFYQRLEALGLVVEGVCPLPFRQQDLADALGLSLVHTNKTLAKLRDGRIADWSKGKLRIYDREALRGLQPGDVKEMHQGSLV